MGKRNKTPEPGTAANIGLAMFSLAGLISLVLGIVMVIKDESAVFYSAGDRYGQACPSPYPIDGISMLVLGAVILIIAAIAFYQKRREEGD